MRSTRYGFMVVALAAAPALAQFEGELDMKMTMKDGGTGTTKTFVSRIGARMEMVMNPGDAGEKGKPDSQGRRRPGAMGMGPITMTTLFKTANPDTVYMLNDRAKTYSEIDLKETREMVKGMPEHTYTVKKLGKERILGFSTEHVLVTSSTGTETEMWVSKEIFSRSLFQNAGRGGGERGLMKALKDNGVEGIQVKMIMREKGSPDPTMTMELVKAERMSIPASRFEIPAGYEKREGMMGGMNPEMQDQMKKAMEGMTPEQRKQIEEMMKRRQGGGGSGPN